LVPKNINVGNDNHFKLLSQTILMVKTTKEIVFTTIKIVTANNTCGCINHTFDILNHFKLLLQTIILVEKIISAGNDNHFKLLS